MGFGHGSSVGARHVPRLVPQASVLVGSCTKPHRTAADDRI
nr:hypothetical protein [Kibdelosporangium sp. MJ126-NF4]CTQ88641.1 hypothetical protein [Kibdelosporangium sp. MJ126-NF4]